MLRWRDEQFFNTNTMDLLKIAKEAFATDVKRELDFHPGDTITVAYKIIEGT